MYGITVSINSLLSFCHVPMNKISINGVGSMLGDSFKRWLSTNYVVYMYIIPKRQPNSVFCLGFITAIAVFKLFYQQVKIYTVILTNLHGSETPFKVSGNLNAEI